MRMVRIADTLVPRCDAKRSKRAGGALRRAYMENTCIEAAARGTCGPGTRFKDCRSERLRSWKGHFPKHNPPLLRDHRGLD